MFNFLRNKKLNKLFECNFLNNLLFLKHLLKKITGLYASFRYSMKVDGIFISIERVFFYIFFKKRFFSNIISANYKKWIELNEYYDKKTIERKINNFHLKPKISIIIPVYNVKKEWLDKCVESVMGQLYENWELCIHDDFSTNNETINCLKSWEKNDPRIKISYGKENRHISGASNEALKLATGEFVALLDHDDTISPNALYAVIKELNKNPKIDFFYSDEDKIELNGLRSEPFFKPDWDIYLFLSMMYTCHFGVYRKKNIDDIGGFRVGYEGSQDYDLVLRFIDRIDHKNICHIPMILYHWRKVPSSTAANSKVKSYAYISGKKALEDYLKRNRISGHVVFGEGDGRYRIIREISEDKKVSILIHGRNKKKISRSLKTINMNTKYKNHEIIILFSGDERLKKNSDNFGENKIIKVGSLSFLSSLNEGVRNSSGDYIVYCDSEVFPLNNLWLHEFVSLASDKKVGIISPKIFYRNNYILHAGFVLNNQGGTYAFEHLTRTSHGYFSYPFVFKKQSGVSQECFFIKRSVFDQIGDLNVDNFTDILSMTDFSLRAQSLGFEIVYNPYVNFMYRRRFKRHKNIISSEEQKRFRIKWEEHIEKDLNYNVNLVNNGILYRVKRKKINS